MDAPRTVLGQGARAVQRENLQLYVFGDGRQGQLGHGQLDIQASPLLIETLTSDKRRKAIQQICCGSTSSWVLLETGECLAWGELRGMLQPNVAVVQEFSGIKVKQIAAGGSAISVLADPDDKKDEGSDSDSVVIQTPSVIRRIPWGYSTLPVISTATVQQIAVNDVAIHLGQGPGNSLELTNDGRVFSNGSAVPALPKSIVSIGAGAGYFAALSNTGELFTWGISGPLGHKGPSNPINPWPERVLGALKGKKVISMACGRNHMACVTDNGELYTWGSASHNQLGHGDGKDTQDPLRVQALQGKKVIAVSCGDHHTACILDTGVLYTFGYGARGALGHGEFKNEEFPRVVEALQDKMVRSVACGAEHTMCVVVADINQSLSLLKDEMGRLFELANESPAGADEASADLKLVCGNDSSVPPVYCHRVVLSARCKELERQIVELYGDKGITASESGEAATQNEDAGGGLSKDAKELVVWGIDHPTLVEMTRYIYCDGIPSDLGLGMLISLIEAASRFGLEGLSGRCWAFWEDTTTTENVKERMSLLQDLLRSLEEKEVVEKEETKQRVLKDLISFCERILAPQEAEKKEGEKKDTERSEVTAETQTAEKEEHKKPELDRGEGIQSEQTQEEGETDKANCETKEGTRSLSQDLEAFLDSPRFADILFSVEGRMIYAHKALLCARSTHFKAMLMSGMKEAQSGRIEIGELSYDAFMSILQHLYTGKANITQDNVVELLVTSNLYTIRQLQEQCESFIEGGIYHDNVTALLEMAHRFQTHHLRCVAMNYLLQTKGDMTKMEGFADLSPEIVEEFKRGTTHGPSCTIEAAEGGFVGDTFHFVIVARDAFGTKTTKENETWDVKVLYLGENEEKTRQASNVGEGKESEQQKSEGDSKRDENVNTTETKETEIHKEPTTERDEKLEIEKERLAKTEKEKATVEMEMEMEKGKEKEKETNQQIPSDSVSTPFVPSFTFPSVDESSFKSPETFSFPSGSSSPAVSPFSFASSPGDSPREDREKKSATPLFSLSMEEQFPSSVQRYRGPRRTRRKGGFSSAFDEAGSEGLGTEEGEDDENEDEEGALVKEEDEEDYIIAQPPAAPMGMPPRRATTARGNNARVVPPERTIVKVVRTRQWNCQACGKTDNKPDSRTCEACGVQRGQKALSTFSSVDGQELVPVFLTASSPLQGDGTYMASFFPPKAGKYQINVLYGGVHIKDSPMDVLVENTVDTRKCTVTFGDGKTTCWTKAGAEVKAIIQANDKYGNKVTVGGLSGSFEASVHQAPEKWTPQGWRKYVNAVSATLPTHISPSLALITPEDNRDGTYTIVFYINGTGEYLLDVVRKRNAKLKVPVAGVPLLIYSAPGDTWGPNCIVKGDDLHIAMLDRRVSFRIIAKDKFNNIKDSGGDVFNVRIVKTGSVKMVRNALEEMEKREAEEAEKKREERKKRNAERLAKGLPLEEEEEEEKARKELLVASLRGESGKEDEEKDPAALKKEEAKQTEKEASDEKEKDKEIDKEEEKEKEKEKGKEKEKEKEQGKEETAKPKRKERGRKESEAERKVREEREKKKKEKEEREKKIKEEWLVLEQDLERECLVRGEVDDLGNGIYEVTYTMPRDLGIVESYQLTITLKDGGLIRDAPFNLLLFEHEEEYEKSRTAIMNASSSSSYSSMPSTFDFGNSTHRTYSVNNNSNNTNSNPFSFGGNNNSLPFGFTSATSSATPTTTTIPTTSFPTPSPPTFLFGGVPSATTPATPATPTPTMPTTPATPTPTPTTFMFGGTATPSPTSATFSNAIMASIYEETETSEFSTGPFFTFTAPTSTILPPSLVFKATTPPTTITTTTTTTTTATTTTSATTTTTTTTTSTTTDPEED